ncbi:MAG TPA: hypothetical protein VNZ86_07585 [Bacteroidia bacterium]|jgi:hypothetical protein|nr:hypothetical protein [Bacteroidia bacterium]
MFLKRIYILFLTFCVPLLFQRCAGVFINSTTQSPNLITKDQRHANLYLGADHEEVQAAWSPKEHIGFMMSSYLCSPFVSSGHDYNSWGTVQGDLAMGFYHAFHTDTARPSKWFYDVYLGGGLGQRKFDGELGYAPGHTVLKDGYTVYLSDEKSFLQSSVFYRKNNTEVSLTVQGAVYFLNSFNLYMTRYELQPLPTPILVTEFHNESFYNLNTAFTVKQKTGLITLVGQLAWNHALSYPSGWKAPYYTDNGILPWTARVVEINFGVQFKF